MSKEQAIPVNHKQIQREGKKMGVGVEKWGKRKLGIEGKEGWLGRESA